MMREREREIKSAQKSGFERCGKRQMREKNIKGKGREKDRFVKDATENVKRWKKMKEDREELR